MYKWRKYKIPSNKNPGFTYGQINLPEPDGSGDNFDHVIKHDYMTHFT